MGLWSYIQKNKVKSLGVIMLLTAAFVFVITNSFAGSGLGPAYDWQKGEVLNNFLEVSSMPEGWDFVSFSYEDEAGRDEAFGMWVPISEPLPGARDLTKGDNGSDVLALQKTINLLRSEDKNDPYYFDKIEETGSFTEATEDAVKMFQIYFDYPENGIADLDFQASLYHQVITPGE